MNHITSSNDKTQSKNQGDDGKKYYFAEKFPSLEIAQKAIEEQDTWPYKATQIPKKTEEKKLFYQCNKVTQRCKVQCSTGAVLILSAESQEVELHKTFCAHDHIPRKFSVSIETRAENDSIFLVTKNFLPIGILENLELVPHW